MSYFVKKTEKPKGTYLQIYNSYYVPGNKNNKSELVKTLGYVDELKNQGIDDPIAFYTDECKKKNQEIREEKKIKKSELVDDKDYLFNYGYFLVKSIMNTLNLKQIFDIYCTQFNKRFNHYNVFTNLVYSRIVGPCSKLKTHNVVLPRLYEKPDFSLDDIYTCLDDLGSNYHDIIAILNAGLGKFYKFDTSKVFFDCTNFYFEIDREDTYRRKGPSKEKRTDPLVGLGLLLDKNCIPITMQLYPGNESEIYRLGECINEAKNQGLIVGRTIHVADKGLNCARNIFEAKKSQNGYIFSKSVYKLPEIEQQWLFLEDDYTNKYTIITDPNTGEVIFKYKTCVDDYNYSFEEDDENGKAEKHVFKVKEKRVLYWSKKLHEKKIYELNNMQEKLLKLITSKAKKEEFGPYSSYVILKTEKKNGQKGEEIVKAEMNSKKFELERKLAGFNLLVTSEINESPQKIYDIYHELWKIEETFRILKNYLNTRPVFLQKREKIDGHMLVCYTSILLTRILQFLVFKDKLDVNDIYDFIKNAQLIIDNDIMFNLLKSTYIKKEIIDAFPLDFNLRRPTVDAMKKIMEFKVKI